ncbi:MAG: hypothetical protein K2H85_12210 [Allobaculum sp.]|nr:hypothetical protein [Allobaculum sp.]
MINKAKLKELQPVAYRTLSNALLSKHISHAYLFFGPKNMAKHDLALLFAQSLVCPHCDEDGFACGQCAFCEQLAKEENPDFFWLHPGGLRKGKPLSRKELEAWWKGQSVQETSKIWSIRKEDILALQDAFSTSALSEAQKQIYILEGYDQATAAASNSLLKFLEEPKDNLVGILIVDELANVLPTIVSRCQLIPFRARSRTALEDELSTWIADQELVAILAKAGYDWNKARSLLEEEAAFEIRDAAQIFWPRRMEHLALVELQLGVFSKKNHLNRPALEFFFHCLLYYLEKDRMLNFQSLQMRFTLLNAIDGLKAPLDPALMLERTVWGLQKSLRADLQFDLSL